MNTHTNWAVMKVLGVTLGYACLVALIANQTPSAEANWYTPYSANNGFSVARELHVGPSTLCPADRMEIEYRVRDAETLGPVTNAYGLWARMRYEEDNGNTVYVPWLELRTASKASQCVPRDAWAGVRIVSDFGSEYVGAMTTATRILATSSRQAELGQHYVRTIYLSRHTDPSPTVTPVSPIRTVASSSSGIRFRINEFPNIYGANRTTRLAYWIYNLDRAVLVGRDFAHSATAAGDYTFAAPGVTDGFQQWLVGINYNGEHTVNGLRYTELPATNFLQDWFTFVYDATPPNSSLSSTVQMQNSDTQRISLSNTVSDATSGLAQTVIVIENRTTGARTNLTQNFPLAMGSYYGTWRDPQVVATTIEVSRDHAYALYAITRDVGGNVRTTEPTIIPDRDGNTGGAVGTNLTVGLSANPASIILGAQSTLSWNIQNATGCTASWNPGFTFTNGVPGSLLVSPTSTTNYILNCSNATTNASRQATINVTPFPPTLNINTDQQFIRKGEATTLTWSVVPSVSVTSCTMTGLNSTPTSVSTSGSAPTPTLTNQRTFTLACTGPIGTFTASTTVQIIPEVFEP